MRANRLLLIGVGILALLFSTATAQGGTIQDTFGLTPNLILEPGESLVLQGYSTVIIVVEDGVLTGNDLTFSSGGSIDFWGASLLNTPFVPVTSVMGSSVSFCTFSTPCGPFPGDLGFFVLFLPTNVGDILIEASTQIIFKGTPPSSVPEPTTGLLLGGALVAFGIQRRNLRFH